VHPHTQRYNTDTTEAGKHGYVLFVFALFFYLKKSYNRMTGQLETPAISSSPGKALQEWGKL
jgi:hypothetical protein